MNFAERPDWDEGTKVELGSQNLDYAPPVKPVVRDLSVIKSLRKYFAPYRFQPYPSWIYHPTESARVVNNAKEAAEYGIVYRKATEEEQIRYHAPSEFYDSTGEWRTKPYPKDIKFDHENLQPGKTYVPRVVDQAKQQTALLEILAQGHGHEASFTEVQLLKEQVAKMQALIEQISGNAQPRSIQSTVEPEVTTEAHKNALSEIFSDPEVELQSLRNEAEALGIDVDGRWSIKRLKLEIDNKKAAV